jgi:hypothetical protein
MEKAENIFGGVYLISDKALFEQTISARPDPGVFHVYLGYAGWTQDQLRTESQLGAWFVFPADAATVFNSDPDSLWLQMIQKTELQLAKTEPFAETSQPVTFFDKSGITQEQDLTGCTKVRLAMCALLPPLRQKRWHGTWDGVVPGRCLANTISDEDRPQA